MKIFNFLSTTRVLAEVQVESSRARAEEDIVVARLSVESDERTDLLEKLAGDLKYKRIAPELVSRLATMVAEGSCPLKLGETIIGIYGSDSIEDSMILIESAK